MTTIHKHKVGALAASLVMLCCGSAQGEIIQLQGILSGPAEAPPNTSPGSGVGTVFIDTVAHTIRVQATFFNLLGDTTASHIHAVTVDPFSGTAGVATQVPSFIGFPLGVKSGTFDNTFDLTAAATYNPAFLTAQGGSTANAEEALVNALLTGRAYLNIHSTEFRGGEIRTFPTRVPDNSATAPLLALGLLAVLGVSRSLRAR